MEKENAKMESSKRLYQVWKGRNKFFLGGRLIFGPDVRSVALTLFLVLAPVSIFCFCVFHDFHHWGTVFHPWGIAVPIFTIVFTAYDLFLLFLTSGTDPGIIPRNTHPPEPDEDYVAASPAEFSSEQTPRMQIPRTKDVIVNGVAVKVKFCYTCMLYRPPRCSHCSICNNCVERFDHHCPWVGQCIGERNYQYFFMFVLSSTLLCLYVFAFCLVDLIEYKLEHKRFDAAYLVQKKVAEVVLMCYTFIAFWFVGGLTVFHIYLISTNQTTYENFRARYDSKVNPYNKGLFSNFTEFLSKKIPPPRINFREMVQQDSPLHGVSDTSVHRKSINANNVKSDIDLKLGDMTPLPAVCMEASETLQGHNIHGGSLGLQSKDGYEDHFSHPLDVSGATILQGLRENLPADNQVGKS